MAGCPAEWECLCWYSWGIDWFYELFCVPQWMLLWLVDVAGGCWTIPAVWGKSFIIFYLFLKVNCHTSGEYSQTRDNSLAIAHLFVIVCPYLLFVQRDVVQKVALVCLEYSTELVEVCFVIGIHKNSVFPTGWDQELYSSVGGQKKPGLSWSKSESHLDTNVLILKCPASTDGLHIQTFISLQFMSESWTQTCWCY